MYIYYFENLERKYKQLIRHIMEKEIRFRPDINSICDTEKTGQIAVCKEIIPEKVTNQLQNITKKNKFLSFIVLFAGFQITASKIIDRRGIVICTPNMEGMIDASAIQNLNAYISFECDTDESILVRDFINKVKKIVVEKYQNTLNGYNMSETIDSKIAFGMEGIHCLNGDSKIDTFFSIIKESNKFHLTCTYKTMLYTENYIRKICKAYTHVLTQMINNMGSYIKDIDLVNQEERQELLQFNEDYDIREELSIVNCFEKQVENNSRAKAISIYYNGAEILKKFQSLDGVKNQIWKKCCFEKNSYLVCLLKKIDKNETYAIRTHLRNTVLINKQVMQLLSYMNGLNTLEVIYNEVVNHNLEYYIENKTVNEHSWKDKSSKMEMTCHHDAQKFLYFVYMMQQANLINLKQVKSVSKGISALGPTLTPIRIQNQEVNIKRPRKCKILLLGDTPGEASVGILYIASFLRRNGIEAYCQLNDLNDTYDSLYKNIIFLLKKYCPQIVGISAKWFPHIARVLTMCDIIKQYDSSIKIVVGGNTASLYADKFIEYDTLDYVVCGDGEVPLLKICKNEDDIPNSIYKKGKKVIRNKITYIQDDNNSSEIYLSDLDQIIVDQESVLNVPYIYIYTGKGCKMNCFYCGGCMDAQSAEFSRQSPFIRKQNEVRKDILEAIKMTSTLMFVDSFAFDTERYYSELWSGINLTNYFCDFYFYKLPSFEFICLMCSSFKYVYINIDLCSLSERHRKEMVMQKVMKPLPSDSDLFKLFEACSQIENLEIGISLVSGLPLFKSEDFEIGNEVIKRLKKYKSFKGVEWGRLHAQPMAPLVSKCDEYDMESQAKTFEDFLEYSIKNMEEPSYPDIYSFHVPYIYFNEGNLNSKVTKYFSEINNTLHEKLPYEGIYENISYGELNQVSNQFARQLQQKGITEGDVIGIMLDEQLEAIIAILSALKLGAVYCPIDLNSPKSKIEEIIKSCKINTVVVPPDLILPYSVNTISVDFKCLLKYSDLNLKIPVKQKGYAYIIYTSGTTGKPKGVCIKNESLSNLFQWRIEKYNFTSQDTVLQLLPYYFDGYATNLYSALLSGASLMIMNDSTRKDMLSIKEVIRNNAISNMSIIPSMFQVIVDSASKEDLISLKCIILAAEKTRGELIKSCFEKAPQITFINEYGPTENTIVATANIGMSDKNTSIIGKPIRNVHVYILNSSNTMLPIGLYGEICLSGIGLADRYICEDTSENDSFVKNPWEEGKMYRTGDIGRWMENGVIEFFGREDGQVKIRGIRIETKSIELYLESLPGVFGAVVKGLNYSNETRLVALLETRGEVIDISNIKKNMAVSFPEYMVPSYFYQLKNFPVLQNGKVDREKIEKIVVEQKQENNNNRECNKFEIMVTEIWEDILNIKQVGLNDNFFDIGGTSISLMRMQAEIEKKFCIGISIADLFQYTTVLTLSEYLSHKVRNSFNKKQNYERIALPQKYYMTSKNDKKAIVYLDENKSNKLFDLQKNNGIQLKFVLCGLYCYLLNRLCKYTDITYYIVNENPNICYAVNINLNLLDNFEKLFQLLEEACNSQSFSERFTDDLHDLENDKTGIIPVIVFQYSKLMEILKDVNNVLVFGIEIGKKIKLTMSCTSNQKMFLKLESIMKIFIGILDQFIDELDK